jgi:phage gpG-like protein
MKVRIVNYDRNKLLQAVAEEYLGIVDDQFESGGKDYLPRAWPPLQTKRKRGKRSSAKLLQDTGDLRRNTSYVIQGNTVIFTNNKVYAAIHNFGGEINMPAANITRRSKSGKTLKYKRKKYKVKIPQRQFFVTSDKAVERLRNRVADFLEFGE